MNNARNNLLRRIRGIERSIVNTHSREECERHLRELEIIKRHAQNLPNYDDVVEKGNEVIDVVSDRIVHEDKEILVGGL